MNNRLPALAFGKTRIHAENVAGKQGRLIAASAGANFENDATLVVRVFRQQQFLQINFQLRQPRLGSSNFLFGKFTHFRIAAHRLGFGQIHVIGYPDAVEYWKMLWINSNLTFASQLYPKWNKLAGDGANIKAFEQAGKLRDGMKAQLEKGWREAVEIAKKFSTPSSAPFINGVLDGIRRSLFGAREASPRRTRPAPAGSR